MKLPEYIQKKDIALNNLIAEVTFYPNVDLVGTLLDNVMRITGDFKEIEEPSGGFKSTIELYRMPVVTPEDEKNLFAPIGLRFMQLVGYSYNIKSPEVLKKFNEINKFYSAMDFAYLKALIDAGHTQDAIEVVEVLEQKNNNLYEFKLSLEIEFSKAREKVVKHSREQ